MQSECTNIALILFQFFIPEKQVFCNSEEIGSFKLYAAWLLRHLQATAI